MHVLRPNLISRPVAARQLLPRRARRSSILRRGQSAVTAGEVEQRYGWTLEQDKTKADGEIALPQASLYNAHGDSGASGERHQCCCAPHAEFRPCHLDMLNSQTLHDFFI